MEFSTNDLMGKLIDVVFLHLNRCLTSEKLDAAQKDQLRLNFLHFIEEQRKKFKDPNISSDDVYYLLQYIFDYWQDIKVVFGNESVGRSYINILKYARNKWAHKKPLTNEDVTYFCDTALRLSHLANDYQTVLDLEEIYEYITNRQTPSLSYKEEEIEVDQEARIAYGVKVWSLSLKNNYYFTKHAKNTGILKEFYTLVLDNFSYPWENFKDLYFNFFKFIFTLPEFDTYSSRSEVANLAKLNNGEAIIDNGYDYYEFLGFNQQIAFPIYIDELLELLCNFGAPDEDLGFFNLDTSIKCIFKFIHIFSEEIQKLEGVELNFPIINSILDGEVTIKDIFTLMPSIDSGHSIDDYQKENNDDVITLGTKIITNDSDKEEYVLPPGLTVEKGQFPKTIHFSQGSTSFAYGYKKIITILRYLQFIQAFVNNDIENKNIISKFHGNDVLCLPSVENCEVMFGKIKAQIILNGIAKSLLLLIDDGYINLDEVTVIINKYWK